ncbi:MAG: hypothetical protein IPN78_00140 [Candidatus Accumulibacter sp.]|nr:hypothetical protein [Candidatus Accumulibacter propinquus]
MDDIAMREVIADLSFHPRLVSARITTFAGVEWAKANVSFARVIKPGISGDSVRVERSELI